MILIFSELRIEPIAFWKHAGLLQFHRPHRHLLFWVSRKCDSDGLARDSAAYDAPVVPRLLICKQAARLRVSQTHISDGLVCA